MEPGIIYDEWTEDCEEGALGYQLVLDAGDPLIYMREQDEDGQWSEWEEEDLDGAGESLLKRLPAILAAERFHIRRALIERFDPAGDLDSDDVIATSAEDFYDILDRICPASEEGR